MSTVKYRVREFTPKGNQSGTHSFYAEAVVDNEISNLDLAKKIAARTGFKSYECQAVIAAIADIVAEEVLENNRVCLNGEDGKHLVSFYPKASGRISDNEVAENAEKYGGKQVAEAEMLTADRINWTLGATVGIKYSKRFAIEKQAQKVDYNPADNAAEPVEDAPQTPSTGGSGNGNGGNE